MRGAQFSSQRIFFTIRASRMGSVDPAAAGGEAGARIPIRGAAARLRPLWRRDAWNPAELFGN